MSRSQEHNLCDKCHRTSSWGSDGCILCRSDDNSRFSSDQIGMIGEYLRDNSKPLKGRFRALFVLKNVNTKLSLDQMIQAFDDDSDLLRHEIAYCIGQMGRPEALPALIEIAKDVKNAPIVRHEACEAIGAIGSQDSLELLASLLTDPVPEVAETCLLATKRIEQLHNSTKEGGPRLPRTNGNFTSVDPAYPFDVEPVKKLNDEKVYDMQKVLLREEEALYTRYSAMFSLRNENTHEARRALCKGFSAKSALFRHEIAFVLGQMAHEDCISALYDVLVNTKESGMVRHEAAEALGAIGTKLCDFILRQYLEDPERLVRESCEIALDICEYELANELHYADGNSIIGAVEDEKLTLTNGHGQVQQEVSA